MMFVFWPYAAQSVLADMGSEEGVGMSCGSIGLILPQEVDDVWMMPQFAQNFQFSKKSRT